MSELPLEGDEQGARFETSFDKRSRNSQSHEWARIWHFVTEKGGNVSIGCEEMSFDLRVLRLIQAGLRTASEIAEG